MAEERDILLRIKALGFENVAQVETALKAANKQLKEATDVQQYRQAQQEVAKYSNALGDFRKETKSVAEAQNVQKGSLNDLRNQLKELTSTRNGLPATGKEFQELQKKIKSTSDEIKGIEQQGGDFRRSVGDYAQGTKVFGVSLGDVKTQLTALKAGLGGTGAAAAGTSTGFNVMKIAIAGTGIGLLIIAIGSLVAFFKSTDEGAVKLSGVMSGLGFVFKQITAGVAALGAALMNPKQALIDLAGVIKEQVINRVNGMLGLFKAVSLAISGDFSGAMKLGSESMLQATTGVKDITGKIAAMANGIYDAASAGVSLAKRIDNLDTLQRKYSKSIAFTEAEITKLLIQAKAKNLTEEQQIKILERASNLEEENLKKQLKIAEIELGIARDQNAQVDKNSIDKDAADQKETDAIIKITKLKESSLNLQEKISNRLAAIDEKKLAALQKEKDAQDKLNASVTKKSLDGIKIETKANDQVAKSFNKSTSDQIKARGKLSKIESDALIVKEEEAKKQSELEKTRADASISIASSTFGNLSALFKEGSKEYKIFATAQATSDTLAAAIGAFRSAQVLPFPASAIVGGIAAGAATAFGAAQIAKIQGLNFNIGGAVPTGFEVLGKPLNADNTLAWLTPGEVVLTKNQQSALGGDNALAMAGVPGFNKGGGPNMLPNLTSQATQGFRNSVNRDSLQANNTGRSLGQNMPSIEVSVKEITTSQNKVSVKQSEGRL